MRKAEGKLYCDRGMKKDKLTVAVLTVRVKLSYEEKLLTSIHCERKSEFPWNLTDFTILLCTQEGETAGKAKKAACHVVEPMWEEKEITT